jgi:hypothetical protein
LATETKKLTWDGHILIVYSVLAGLSFDKSFDVFSRSINFGIDALLLGVVFFIVLDNWYNMNVYFDTIDIDQPFEIILYLITAICFSCLPFLYFARSAPAFLGLDSPTLLLINFILILSFDSLAKYVSYRKTKLKSKGKTLSSEKRRLLAKFIFIAFSGLVYIVLMIILLFILQIELLNISITSKAAVVAVFWILIRLLDTIVLVRFHKAIADLI